MFLRTVAASRTDNFGGANHLEIYIESLIATNVNYRMNRTFLVSFIRSLAAINNTSLRASVFLPIDALGSSEELGMVRRRKRKTDMGLLSVGPHGLPSSIHHCSSIRFFQATTVYL